MSRTLLSLPMMLWLLTACVTINIYFPAAAAEEAARAIVRDVLGEDAVKQEDAVKEAPSEKASDDKGASNQEVHGLPFILIGQLLEWSIPAAEAGQADINVNTPAIRQLRSSMRSRQSSLAPYFRSGAIGLDNNGLVTSRDMKAVALKDRNKVKRLVADENADRTALYKEIARANGHPEWEADIRNTFARVWIEEAGAGYWYRDSSGSWRSK